MLTPEERQVVGFVRRLEHLASGVSDRRFLRDSATDFLSYQESIGKVQRDIQAAIAEYKRRLRQDKALRPHLQRLRELRWHSRRLGDAVAWSILLYNRQVLISLSQNEMVPVPGKEDHGMLAAFSMARALASREWGLPIVHDITSVLRIGDITFMKPNRNPKKAVYKTFELKASKAHEEPNLDGTSTVTFNVQVISNEPIPDRPNHIPPPDPAAGPPPARKPDRRLDAQLKRMSRMVDHRDAAVNDITRIAGDPSIQLLLDEEAEPQWAELRRAIRKARRDGYAYFSIDGFVGYGLFYDRSGVDLKAVDLPSLAEDIKSTLTLASTKQNSITVSSVPDEERDFFSNMVLPVFLWEVPRIAINDILRGRLVISAIFNSARVEELLEAEGFTVRHDDKDLRNFVYAIPVDWPTGERGEMEVHAPWMDMYMAVHEFRGARSIVQRALAIAGAPTIISYEKFQRGGATTEQ
jgi:hypothetical protein